MFRRKKMSENDINQEEFAEGDASQIPVNDKRRFDSEGEMKTGNEFPTKEFQRSPREADLELQLAKETERRQAAESKLVGVQAKFDEAKSNLDKETAEMRARMTKTLEDRARQGQLNFLTTLLPVLDNLNLAIAASEKDPSLEHLREGVKGTARSFEQALMSVGAESVPSIGSNFDPELHEAIDMTEVGPEDDGKVTAEYSRGYKFGDRLLRPAKVQVGKARAHGAAE
jgi:molecular chaperone GrpE